MAAVLVVMLLGSLLALLPDMAQAHRGPGTYHPPGLGGATISLDKDGYDNTSDDFTFTPTPIQVEGSGFGVRLPEPAPGRYPDVAQIFQCAEGAVDLHAECQRLGGAPTDHNGYFHPIGVVVTDTVRRTEGPNIFCAGAAGSKTQCSVVAATFGTNNESDQPTAKAEHFICFWRSDDCKPRPAAPTATTTTTTATTTTIAPTTTTSTTSTTVPSVPEPTCKLREDGVIPPEGGGLRGGDPEFEDHGRRSENTGDLLWVERPQAAAPPPRQGHAMAYLPPVPGIVGPVQSSRPGQTVMFGGFRSGSSGCVLGDTWIWDGVAWRQALAPNGDPVPGPPARYGHVMAFDGIGIVLFGGYDGSKDLGDTWTWNGTTWTVHCKNGVSPDNCKDLGGDARAPSARARTAMAYFAADPAEPGDDRAVLFGGSQIHDNQESFLGDTWSWNGGTGQWAEHVPPNSPMPRATHHMAYRPGSGAVLHGSVGRSVKDSTGTFTWDGRTWTARDNGPEASRGAMAYHPSTDLVVLQIASKGMVGSGMVWDGIGWNTLSAGGPNGRYDAAMAEDAFGNVVFFGGFGWEGSVLPRGDDAERADTWTLVTPASAGAETGEHVTLEVDPLEIDADGKSTAEVTFTATWAGIPQEGYEVELSTNGDTTFAENQGFTYIKGGMTDINGQYTTLIRASKTPGLETITATYRRPPRFRQLELDPVRYALSFVGRQGALPVGEPRPVYAVLAEKGATLTLDPVAIHADGKSTSVATARLYKAGAADEKVCFKTDGNVTFGPPGDDDCATKTGANTWKITITSSTTPGVEAITATGVVSHLSATADLYVGMGTWVNRTADGPNPDPGRENGAVAYDEANNATVLFGGYYGNHHRTSRLAEELPSRGCDPARNQKCPPTPAMLVGDTWIWDGSAWTKAVNPNWELEKVDKATWKSNQVATPEQPLVNSPTPREGAAMAYDASSGKLVLFGGHDGTDYLGDTWTFDTKAKTWTRHCRNGLSPDSSCDALGGDVPAPSKRYVANMASDGTGVVLFAGTAGYGYTMHGPTEANGPGRLRDTWIWRNGAWKDTTPARPPPPPPPPTRKNTFSNEQPIVVPLRPIDKGCPFACEPDVADPYPSAIPVSGLTGKVVDVNVTLHDLSWTKDDPADADIMVVAPGGQSVIVMSDACGADDPEAPADQDRPVPNEPGNTLTLTFDDGAGAELSPDGPCTSGTYRPTNPKRTSTFQCTPGHKEDFFPAPARRQGGRSLSELNAGVHANGTWSLYVVDDCPNDPHPIDAAGRIAGGWSIELTTTDVPASPPPKAAISPPGRGRAAIAYHPPTGKVVMYGGTQEFNPNYGGVARPWGTTGSQAFRPLGDTWIWDPGALTWTQEGTGTHPGERRSALMAYHPRTGNLMLFGGASAVNGRVADPDARPECPVATCLSHHEFTGGGWSWLNDTWSWDGKAWSHQPTPSRPPGQFPAGMALDAAGRLMLVAVGELTEEIGSFSTASTWTWDSTVTLRLSPQSLPADGTSTSVATARVNDAEGNGVAGLGVVFSTNRDVSLSAVTDHGNGTYSVNITASLSGEIETLTVRTPLGTASASLFEVAAASGPCDVGGQPGTWSRVRDLPIPARENLAAAAGGDGRIYVFGGSDGGGTQGDNTVFNLVQSYDPCTNAWQTLPQMPGGARSFAGAAAGADGSIYVVGGSRYSNVAMDLAEVYTPGSGSTPGRWQTLETMWTAKAAPGVAVDQTGNVYATGGFHVEAAQAKSSQTVGVYNLGVYNPNTGLWTEAPDMSIARRKHGAAAGPDGRVFAIGGESYGGKGPAAGEGGRSAEAHTPATGSWEQVRPLSVPRYSVGVSTGPDSLIYAVGGDTDDPAAVGVVRTETVEAYAACVDAWAPVEPMSYRRHRHAVATGPDGRVYVLGGRTQSTANNDPQAVTGLNSNVTTPVEAYTVDPLTSPCAKVSVQGSEVQESKSATTAVKFTISIDRPLTETAVVDYKTRDRTAQAGGDYVETSGSVIFEPLDTTPKEIFVTVNPDTLAEKTEAFELLLSGSTQPSLVTFVNNPGIGTILDAGAEGDPALPTLAIAGDTVDESFVNPMTGHFTVTMSKALSEPVTFNYSTTDGTAKAGSDYSEASGPMTIPAGEVSVNIPVTVLPDETKEQPEHFTMTISDPSGATIAVPQAEATIFDAVEGLRIDDKPVWEGNSQVVPATFTVSLGRPAAQPVSVEWATSDDSARAWDDYNPIRGTVQFAPGEYEKTVTVGVLGDHVPEPTERYSVALSKPVGERIGSGDGTGTIYDDDGPLPAIDPQPAPPGLAVVAPPPPPPPAPIAQAQPQAQSQAQQQMQQQSQQQAQQQAQSQGQGQAQQQVQSQGQSQAQSQVQSQGQSQAQSHGQAGLADERHRERHVEQAHISGLDKSGGEHLATGVHQSSPAGPAALWGGLVVVGLAVAFSRQTSPQRAPTPARAPLGHTARSAQLSTQRIRGRHRRR